MGSEKVSVEKAQIQAPVNFQSKTFNPTELRETEGAVHVPDTWKSCPRFRSEHKEHWQQPEGKTMLEMKLPPGENQPTLHGPSPCRAGMASSLNAW